MLLIDRWIEQLATRLQDPLLTAEKLRDLRKGDMVRLIREEREILALSVLLPVTRTDVVLAALWAAAGQEHMELGASIATQAINHARQRGLTIIVPSTFLPYVRTEVRTPKEAGRPLETVLRDMSQAGVPRKHAIRDGGLKIVPAPTLSASTTPPELRCEL